MAVIHDVILVSNLFVKQMHFEKAGDVMQGHSHKFDHPTLLAKGSIRVTVNDVISIFNAPHMIFIKKETDHQLEALEDDCLAYCIHPIRGEKQEDIYGPEQIPAGINYGLNLLSTVEERMANTHFDDNTTETS